MLAPGGCTPGRLATWEQGAVGTREAGGGLAACRARGARPAAARRHGTAGRSLQVGRWRAERPSAEVRASGGAAER